MSVNVVQEMSSLRCNESVLSSGGGPLAGYVDTPVLCCPCRNNTFVCETLDDAFSLLENASSSQRDFYAYVALDEAMDASPYHLLQPHVLNGNSSEIAMHGFGDVSIECAPGAGLVINKFSVVIIEGTSWKECGLVTTLGHDEDEFHSALFIINSSLVILRDVGFVGSRGSGVFVRSDLNIPNVTCSCTFQNCNFSANNESAALGGGGVYYYSQGSTICSLTFIRSNFVSNNANSGGAVSIISYLSTTVKILDCNFTNNTAINGDGGALFVTMYNSSSTLTCDSSNFNENQATGKGGAVYITKGGAYFWEWASFSGNSAIMGGAIFSMEVNTLQLYYCHWEENIANTSAALLALSVPDITVNNCCLVRNRVKSIFFDEYGSNCIVNIIDSSVLLTNFTVENSFGSGLCSIQSDVMLSGTNTFTSNLGYRGGGINLVRRSLLDLKPRTELIFEANNATYGGGLYRKNFGTGACVFVFNESLSIRVTFQDNYGYVTGDSIYFTTPTNQCNTELKALGISFSGVSSPAANLTFLNTSLDLVLGQKVTLFASITDFFSNPTNVYVDMLLLPPSHQLDQDIPYNLQGYRGFTIQTGVTTTTVYITGEDQANENYIFHFQSSTAMIGPGVNLAINIVPCPIGLFYNSLSSQCSCTSNSNLYCNLDSAFACVLQGYWHGLVNEVYVTSPCYSGYCENTISCIGCDNDEDFIDEYCQLPKQDSNEQCSAYRQGILCTECQVNYSFTFGAIKCVSSDTCEGGKVIIPFIVLVLFVIIFVIALVIVLKLGYGTNSAYVYGFVYYYSIVRTLLPANEPDVDLLLVISIFESLTQLNPQFLGYVNICFTSTMTVLDQQVLQYINPTLITLLVLGFLFLSRYCSKYVNFRDNTPVRAICLLILLSFTSLSLTSYRILAPITFTEVNKTYVNIEPSVEYFSNEHLYFFIIASLIMGVFVVPFTLFLFLAPCLMRVCNLVRIKPFLDEFQGCYKDRYRWMAGFYFLCRLVYLLRGHFIPTVSTIRGYLFQFLSFGIVVFHLLLHPYKDNKLNFADAILLTDITLITLLHGETANILFSSLQTFHTILVFILSILPFFVLTGLFVSNFDVKSFRDSRQIKFLRKKSSKRKRHFCSKTHSTTALCQSVIDGGKNEVSQDDDYNWQLREPMLELIESSGIRNKKRECKPYSITPPSSSIVTVECHSYRQSRSGSVQVSTQNQT